MRVTTFLILLLLAFSIQGQTEQKVVKASESAHTVSKSDQANQDLASKVQNDSSRDEFRKEWITNGRIIYSICVIITLVFFIVRSKTSNRSQKIED